MKQKLLKIIGVITLLGSLIISPLSISAETTTPSTNHSAPSTDTMPTTKNTTSPTSEVTQQTTNQPASTTSTDTTKPTVPTKETDKTQTTNDTETQPRAPAKVTAAGDITMDDTSFYDIAHFSDNHVEIIQYQADGSSAVETGRMKLKQSFSSLVNGLGKNQDAFYFASGTNLYKADASGNTTLIASLAGNTAAAGMSPDGSKYYYTSNNYIYSIDVNTKETQSFPMTLKNPEEGFQFYMNGDLIVDGSGYVWKAQFSSTESHIIRIDPTDGKVDNIIPIKYKDGSPLQSLGELAFLSDGTMVGLDGGKTPYDIVAIDPATGIVNTGLAKTSDPSYDFASSAFPDINPAISVEKSVTPTTAVSRGDVLTYTLTGKNTGNLAATETKLKDSLPKYTVYVPGSTTLNGAAVADTTNLSPLFNETGLPVHSPSSSQEGVVFRGDENAAVVTFKVTVGNDAPAGDSIFNQAIGTIPDRPEVPSNKVTTPVILHPKLENEKHVYDAKGHLLDGKQVSVGDELTYQITSKNIGEKDSISKDVKISISDQLPKGLLFQKDSLAINEDKATSENDQYVTGQKIANVPVGNIKSDETGKITFKVKVTNEAKGKKVANIATIQPGGETPPETTPPVTVFTPDFDGQKSVDKKEAKPGDILTYTVTAKNIGDVTGKTIIEDTLPENTTYVPESTKLDGKLLSDSASWTDQHLTVHTNDVPAGNTTVVTFQVKISNSLTKDTKIENVATVDGHNPPPVDTDVLVPKFAGHKSVDKKEAKRGDILTYTVTAKNIGKLADHTTIKDTLPEGTAYLPNSTKQNGQTLADQTVWYENQLTIQTPEVKPNDSITVTFQVKINTQLTVPATITNIALVADAKTPPAKTNVPKTKQQKEQPPTKKIFPNTGEKTMSIGVIFLGAVLVLTSVSILLKRKYMH